MALVIGPTQPPPLAVVVWHDLNHADAAINARGQAGAIFLTLVLLAAAAASDPWLPGRSARWRGPS